MGMGRKLQVKPLPQIFPRPGRIVRQQNFIGFGIGIPQKMRILRLRPLPRPVRHAGYIKRQPLHVAAVFRQPDKTGFLQIPLYFDQAVVKFMVPGRKINAVTAFQPFQLTGLRQHRLHPVINDVTRQHDQISFLSVGQIHHIGEPFDRFTAVYVHVVDLQDFNFPVCFGRFDNDFAHARGFHAFVQGIKRQQQSQRQHRRPGEAALNARQRERQTDGHALWNVVQRDGGVHHQPPFCARRNTLQPLRSAQKRIHPGDHRRAERKAERHRQPAARLLPHRGQQHAENRRRAHHARRKAHAGAVFLLIFEQKDERRARYRHQERKKRADARPENCFHRNSPLCHAMRRAEKACRSHFYLRRSRQSVKVPLTRAILCDFPYIH